MVTVSFLFAITNPLDKKLVLMSDVFTESAAYGFGLVLAFFLLGKRQGADFGAAICNNVKRVSLAGLFDAISLLFQLAAYAYISGVITDKVIAASVMFAGVLILYLPLSVAQSWGLLALTLAAMSLAMYLTRNQCPET